MAYVLRSTRTNTGALQIQGIAEKGMKIEKCAKLFSNATGKVFGNMPSYSSKYLEPFNEKLYYRSST